MSSTSRVLQSTAPHSVVLDSIHSLISRRKLQWVAHCARWGKEDLTWKRERSKMRNANGDYAEGRLEGFGRQFCTRMVYAESESAERALKAECSNRRKGKARNGNVECIPW